MPMKGMNNMYNTYKPYPCPYFVNTSRYNSGTMFNAYKAYRCPYRVNMPIPNYSNQFNNNGYVPFAKEMKDNDSIQLKDYGHEPFAINIEEATKENTAYRTTLWTGKHFQLTLMSINVGDDIGLEVHPNVDQFIRIEDGQGIVKMGTSKNDLDFQRNVHDGFALFIPAGTWHNLINTGNKPLKLYSIYAPPQHPHGTVHQTKAIAQAAGD